MPGNDVRDYMRSLQELKLAINRELDAVQEGLEFDRNQDLADKTSKVLNRLGYVVNVA